MLCLHNDMVFFRTFGSTTACCLTSCQHDGVLSYFVLARQCVVLLCVSMTACCVVLERRRVVLRCCCYCATECSDEIMLIGRRVLSCCHRKTACDVMLCYMQLGGVLCDSETLCCAFANGSIWRTCCPDLKLEGESVVGRGSGDHNEAPGQWVQCSKLFRLLLGHWKLM